MLNKKSLLLFSLLSLFFFCDCKKYNEPWLYFDETSCLYPWGTFKQDGTEDDKITEAVKKILGDQDIKVIKIKIEKDKVLPGQVNCMACYCKTGRRIHCRVYKKDVTAMQNNGFYE